MGQQSVLVWETFFPFPGASNLSAFSVFLFQNQVISPVDFDLAEILLFTHPIFWSMSGQSLGYC